MMVFWILLLLGSSFPTNAHAAGDALAEVDGVAITSEEVEKALASQLGKLEEQIYNLKRQRVEALINDKLLAKEAARGEQKGRESFREGEKVSGTFFSL